MMFEVLAIDFFNKAVTVKFDKEHYRHYSFNDIILMQSTGLFDKNGVEIFEGDVVEYIDGEFSFIGKVIKSPLGTYVTGSDNHSFEDFTDETTMVSDVSVVGNIYENPDLLESVEE
ncbi:hypothetical protein BOVMAS33_07390 [Streptococcus uberis]